MYHYNSYTVIMICKPLPVPRKHVIQISWKLFATQFLENFEYMSPHSKVHGDVLGRLSSSSALYYTTYHVLQLRAPIQYEIYNQARQGKVGPSDLGALMQITLLKIIVKPEYLYIMHTQLQMSKLLTKHSTLWG